MRLYSIQPVAVLEDLTANEILYADPVLGMHREFIPMYFHIVDKMKECIPGFTGAFPWWAYYKTYKNKYEPDVDCECLYYKRREKLCILHLEVPNDLVLLSSFTKWERYLFDRAIGFEEIFKFNEQNDIIQACFEVLKLDYVKDVEYFTK